MKEMTQQQKDEFISMVYQVAKQHPELQREVTNAFTQGTLEYINTLKQQTADMETIAMAYASISEAKGKGTKSTKMWAHNLILSKLKKHQDVDAFMNWSSNIEECEKYLRNENLI